MFRQPVIYSLFLMQGLLQRWFCGQSAYEKANVITHVGSEVEPDWVSVGHLDQ